MEIANNLFFKRLFDPTDDRPLVIAELSGNHNKSFSRVMKLIEAAADCGVDAIKIQTYTADTITINSNKLDFIINNPGSPWHKKTLYDLYADAHTPWEWHEEIISYAEKLNLFWFSSPFDKTAINFLEKFNPQIYKIASPEIVDLELIKACSQTEKGLIISTGMASISEIHQAVETARKNGCKNLCLLKCTSGYPTSPNQMNLSTINNLKSIFNCPVGLSDHTLGITVPITSIACGAKVIEKHFTLSRKDGGPDSHFSLEPNEMKDLVNSVKVAYQAIGQVSYEIQEDEKPSLQGRRSLYIVKDIKEGEQLSHENVRSIRPGYGLNPSMLDFVIGKKVNKNIDAGSALNLNMII